MNLLIFSQASMQNYTPGFYYTTVFEHLFSPVQMGRIIELKNDQNNTCEGIDYNFW